MSIFTALTKWKYSVESPGVGRLIYREANREYTFPVYEEDGVLVLVGVPSSQRIHFFFNWYWHPRDFPAVTGARILPRIAGHLRAAGAEVRVLTRGQPGELDLEFHPELFECRGEASELLEEAGFNWFGDYSSIELLHEDYGLEISGIKDRSDAQRMLTIMRHGFPHWHHTRMSFHDRGRDAGWTLSICMFPPQSCASGWYEED